ncbi:MAG: HEAT repeat domain-containing protein [Candidatus Odinarchaeota archaeon]
MNVQNVLLILLLSSHFLASSSLTNHSPLLTLPVATFSSDTLQSLEISSVNTFSYEYRVEITAVITHSNPLISVILQVHNVTFDDVFDFELRESNSVNSTWFCNITLQPGEYQAHINATDMQGTSCICHTDPFIMSPVVKAISSSFSPGSSTVVKRNPTGDTLTSTSNDRLIFLLLVFSLIIIVHAGISTIRRKYRLFTAPSVDRMIRGEVHGKDSARASNDLSLDQLHDMLGSHDRNIRRYAIDQVASSKDGRLLDDLIGLLDDPDDIIRLQVVYALTMFSQESVIEPLISKALDDENPDISTTASKCLINLAARSLPVTAILVEYIQENFRVIESHFLFGLLMLLYDLSPSGNQIDPLTPILHLLAKRKYASDITGIASVSDSLLRTKGAA